jgi:hypothetical protein
MWKHYKDVERFLSRETKMDNFKAWMTKRVVKVKRNLHIKLYSSARRIPPCAWARMPSHRRWVMRTGDVPRSFRFGQGDVRRPLFQNAATRGILPAETRIAPVAIA